MAKFEVEIFESLRHCVMVDAKSKEEAIEKARENYLNMCALFDDDVVYYEFDAEEVE